MCSPLRRMVDLLKCITGKMWLPNSETTHQYFILKHMPIFTDYTVNIWVIPGAVRLPHCQVQAICHDLVTLLVLNRLVGWMTNITELHILVCQTHAYTANTNTIFELD